MDKVAAATVREWHCDKQLSVSDVCNFTLQIDISCVDILGPPKARKKKCNALVLLSGGNINHFEKQD